MDHVHRPVRPRLMLSLVLCCAGSGALHAQTFHVLHSFVNESEGFSPDGLTLGPDGALYGVASSGGKPASDCNVGCGTIYRLSREGTGWRFTVLHTFQDEPDGAVPYAPMIPGPDGSFYGATAGGGVYGCNHSGCGTIFKLQRPANCKTPSCGWTESVLYSFPGGNDGFEPGFDAPLTFDKERNIYGTTEFGGACASNEYGCGVVFELSPGVGGWSENVLYTFGENAFGLDPAAGVAFDKQGNLFGTTTASNVYELTPAASGWIYNVLLTTADTITAGVLLDKDGNIFSAAQTGGPFEGGSVFEISAEGQTSDLYNFVGTGNSFYPGPSATLVRDGAGNLYGTTSAEGAYGYGTVFELSPNGDSGTYTYTDLHDFSGPDGYTPLAPLVLDKDGNIFGTTVNGGPSDVAGEYSFGVVFEITAN